MICIIPAFLAKARLFEWLRRPAAMTAWRPEARRQYAAPIPLAEGINTYADNHGNSTNQ
jgi:hypothetical protein